VTVNEPVVIGIDVDGWMLINAPALKLYVLACSDIGPLLVVICSVPSADTSMVGACRLSVVVAVTVMAELRPPYGVLSIVIADAADSDRVPVVAVTAMSPETGLLAATNISEPALNETAVTPNKFAAEYVSSSKSVLAVIVTVCGGTVAVLIVVPSK
jgi:hypothetical protein